MAIKGRAGVSSYINRNIDELQKVLRGAAREGGKVFADYVREETPSDDVKKAVRVRTDVEGTHVKATVDVKPGWARSVANWLEWGTVGHFISVDDSQRRGRSVGRINQQVREAGGAASLVIGGKFVGTTVWHPGANPHPVFRPARDLKAQDAKVAAQNYINARVKRSGVVGTSEGDDE